ncbi:4Fe-4S cluster-binding domain-containing protein [Streptomyces sp. ME02-6978a]|uniref:4Fe-4S cluster-binding domain-containing protein n=1 Tax=unclassified Streptomyces TaxID=2593676 RepID=UPI0029A9F096|nr:MULTISPECIES: 4Fe-4S cluster-binding domain-containing protein [unclassified Streptomyces]MDX3086652.1 4Fe-4S cluster-binding domain-containing protein [Streptomyces sp. ME12-02E]MDX3330036.1 4Fe-4S cluster-binding domain-containing protein [Streptomyces sp. ME02-6978a]
MELTSTDTTGPEPAGTALVVNRVHFPVTALGPGRRLGVWVQGCSIGCAGCLAHDTWAAGAGPRLTPEAFREVWRRALERGAEGLTVSGGEPGDQPEALTALLRVARQEAAGRSADLLVYSGHPLAELERRAPEVTGGLADAVIGEPYRADEPTTLIWRGSANQTLTPLTVLGRERYGPWLEHRPGRAPMQLVASDHDAWLIGVPRAGELAALERSLRTAGFRQGQVSWRPARPDAPSAGPYAHPPTIPSGSGETSGDKESDR